MKIQIQTKIFTFRTKTKIVMKDLAFFFPSTEYITSNSESTVHKCYLTTLNKPIFEARHFLKHS